MLELCVNYQRRRILWQNFFITQLTLVDMQIMDG